MRFVTQIAYLANVVFHFSKGDNLMSNKDKITHIRFTQEDSEKIQQEAKEKGMNVSQYIRSCIKGGLYNNPQLRKELCALNYEIHKISVNANQIAYHSNPGILTTREREILLELMKDIRKGVLGITAYCNNSRKAAYYLKQSRL
jgi:glutamine phosphoribosylpyrophosphate amidotransferase